MALVTSGGYAQERRRWLGRGRRERVRVDPCQWKVPEGEADTAAVSLLDGRLVLVRYRVGRHN
jgi:hypothetical protein